MLCFLFLSQQISGPSGPMWPHSVTHLPFLNTFSSQSIPFPFSSKDSFPAHVLSFSPTKRGGIRGTLFLLHLLILKYKLVSMRNRVECVSLTFFVECIRTSCSSNLKRSAAHLIESSPWRLLSGAQVSSKKPSVCMNAANDHMSEGVDPQADSCDPLMRRKANKSCRLWCTSDGNVAPIRAALWKWLTDWVLN